MKSTRFSLPLILFIIFFIFGCGVTTPEYTAPQNPTIDKTSVIVDNSFNKTWDNLIQFTSSHFFAIDNYEKDSGLMTLKFSSDPSRFVDCGYIKTDGPPSYKGDYLSRYQKNPNGSVELNGIMNLTVQDIEKNKTKISVNVRYVVTVTVSNGNVSRSKTWNFNTNGSDTKQVRANNFGAKQKRICKPTHEAEKFVIEGIKE